MAIMKALYLQCIKTNKIMISPLKFETFTDSYRAITLACEMLDSLGIPYTVRGDHSCLYNGVGPRNWCIACQGDYRALSVSPSALMKRYNFNHHDLIYGFNVNRESDAENLPHVIEASIFYLRREMGKPAFKTMLANTSLLEFKNGAVLVTKN